MFTTSGVFLKYDPIDIISVGWIYFMVARYDFHGFSLVDNRTLIDQWEHGIYPSTVSRKLNSLNLVEYVHYWKF